MIVLGIDQGTAHCGYALVEDDGRRITVYCAGSTSLSTNKGREAMRATLIYAATLTKHWCHERRWRGSKGEHSAKVGAIIASGQSAALGTLAEMVEVAGLARKPIAHVSPGTGKKLLTGNGRATKEQMIHAAHIRFGLDLDEHGADAIGIALGGIKHLKGETREKVRDNLQQLSGSSKGGTRSIKARNGGDGC